ncbi:MAG: phosphatidate cytidylyltransferase [Gammaproteobacteria bacterium]|nr:phosphatidate cytidylyltransferase [Gammaproteobacteria bacterium]
MTLSSFQLRTLSTVVLGPLLLWAIVSLQGEAFTLLLVLLLLPAAWEWSRLAGQKRLWPQLEYTALVILLFYASRLLPLEPLLLAALLWWGGALFWLRKFPAQTGWLFNPVLRYIAGLFVLLPAWRALEVIHLQEQGVGLLFFLLLLIWSADIGAYLVGVRMGKHKLAPNVSPGKSIEGVLGGMAAASLVGVAAFLLLDEVKIMLPLFLLSVLLLVIFSVVGDLVESAYKRHVGLKDSGQLIPGHGGILDRVDSLTAAAPLYLVLLLLFGWV